MARERRPRVTGRDDAPGRALTLVRALGLRPARVRRGKVLLRCPLPGHDDRRASAAVFDSGVLSCSVCGNVRPFDWITARGLSPGGRACAARRARRPRRSPSRTRIPAEGPTGPARRGVEPEPVIAARAGRAVLRDRRPARRDRDPSPGAGRSAVRAARVPARRPRPRRRRRRPSKRLRPLRARRKRPPTTARPPPPRRSRPPNRRPLRRAQSRAPS